MVLTAGLLLAACGLYAQTPTLSVGGNKKSEEVYLRKLDMQVEVVGNIATTRFTMSFKNRTGRILEGELTFPLPEGVTVSHYALDINGRMREAVPVEKARATQVFEEIEQRRVDPGLLERVEGNNFRTRIYPIPAHGTRTISIGYEQELTAEEGALRYRLPTDFGEAIEDFSLEATVWQSGRAPQVESGAGELRFDRQGTAFISTFERKDYLPSKLLAFSLPVDRAAPQIFVQPASGSWYFMASTWPEVERRPKVWSDRIGIIWDASLSGRQRDLQRELELIEAIVKQKQALSVTLFLLDNRFTQAGTFAITGGDWSALRRALEAVEYDGGTDFSAVKLPAAPQEYLFFSDGLSTLGAAEFPADKPVHCISSSPKADYSALRWIASQSAGKSVNLNALSQAQAIDELMNETLHFLGVKHPQSVRELYPSIATPVRGNFSVAGIMSSPQAEITLLFGYGNRITFEKTIALDGRQAAAQGNIHRVWAQKKIAELDMRYGRNKQELTELGQQFGIVTRGTSLIVLETLEDYLTYQITPPAELLREYNRARKGREDRLQQQQRDLLAEARAAASSLQKWWKQDFTPVQPKYPQPDEVAAISEPSDEEAIVVSEVLNIVENDVRMGQVEMSFSSIPPMDFAPVEEAPTQLDEVVVIGYGTARRSMTTGSVSSVSEDSRRIRVRGQASMAAPVEQEMMASAEPMGSSPARRAQQGTITLVEIKQDRDYLERLTGDLDVDYDKYLELRETYLSSPVFYFDMADWFFQKGDTERALRILTSIADLELENASLYRLLGYRLKQYGQYELEAWVTAKVIEWRPMEPQSYRDHALALADAERRQEALEMLYATLTQSYSQNIGSRSSGIDEVVVSEINRLIATGEVDAEAIDKQLMQAMPVDIRVVINWNMNSTDIDLHVVDPAGEECYYGHRSTAMGGRISRDITQGYGPEQFLLKKAVKGKYRVYVNYYGDSQVKAEGPSTIMAEIYTGYGTAQEQRRVVCLQLSGNTAHRRDGKVPVAEFEF